MPLIAHDLAGLRLSDPADARSGAVEGRASAPGPELGGSNDEEDEEDEDDYEVTAEQIVRELEQGFGNPFARLHPQDEEEEEGEEGEEEDDDRPPNWVAPPTDASSPSDDLIPPNSPFASDPGIRDAAVSLLHLLTAVGVAEFVGEVDGAHVKLFEAMLEDLWEWPSPSDRAGGQGGAGEEEEEERRERREREERERQGVNEEMRVFVTRQKMAGVKEAIEEARGRICEVARLETQVVISELIVKLGRAGGGEAGPDDVDVVRSALSDEVGRRKAGLAGSDSDGMVMAMGWVDVKGRVEWSRAGLGELKGPSER